MFTINHDHLCKSTHKLFSRASEQFMVPPLYFWSTVLPCFLQIQLLLAGRTGWVRGIDKQLGFFYLAWLKMISYFRKIFLYVPENIYFISFRNIVRKKFTGQPYIYKWIFAGKQCHMKKNIMDNPHINGYYECSLNKT